MKQRLTLPQMLLLGCLLAASVLSLRTALQTGWADFQLMKPRSVIQRWQNSATPPSFKVWGITRNELVRIQGMNPTDPQLVESLGYLYGLQAMRIKSALPEMQGMLLDQAIAHFRAAIPLRPMSPYAWSNLAFALHEKGENSVELWSAFDRAFKYGQREISVQRQLAEIGFARWAELDQLRQNQIREIVATTDRKTRKELLSAALNHKLQDIFPNDALEN